MVIKDEDQHAFDLPQLYQKPDAHLLLDILSQLTCKPRSWAIVENVDGKRIGKSRLHSTTNARHITQYLTGIISSPLKWIEDEDLKESIWATASARLTERSGRTGMSAIERSFEIQTKTSTRASIMLHEPALTADNLGLKTWASSFVLAQRLHSIELPPGSACPRQILELGAGTGLVGIAAAIVWAAQVVLTDLPEIVPNLHSNISSNCELISRHGGAAVAASLDWNSPESLQLANASPTGQTTCSQSSFPIIVAADSIYSASQPAVFVQTVVHWLSPSPEARVILEMPRRSCYIAELELLQQHLIKAGLKMIEDAEEIGHDDWGSDIGDESSLVHCWYSMWTWECPQRR